MNAIISLVLMKYLHVTNCVRVNANFVRAGWQVYECVWKGILLSPLLYVEFIILSCDSALINGTGTFSRYVGVSQ